MALALKGGVEVGVGVQFFIFYYIDRDCARRRRACVCNAMFRQLVACCPVRLQCARLHAPWGGRFNPDAPARVHNFHQVEQVLALEE